MSIPDTRKGDKYGVNLGKSREQYLDTDGDLAPKSAFSRILGDWVLVAVILLTGSLCFGLGLLAGKEEGSKSDSLWVEQLPAEEVSGNQATSSIQKEPVAIPIQPAAAVGAFAPTPGTYVASKSGSKYYLPTCSTAKRIKDENKVWFATKAQAESAGYEPGANCKGL